MTNPAKSQKDLRLYSPIRLHNPDNGICAGGKACAGRPLLTQVSHCSHWRPVWDFHWTVVTLRGPLQRFLP